MAESKFDFQFSMSYEDYLRGLDLENWYRYYFIIKEVIALRPKNILEIGVGNEIVKNCLAKFIRDYKIMDINSKLNPDILSDLREFHPELKEKFDCIICADVLEHMPFNDLEKNLRNIHTYLIPEGRALITIPHRSVQFMFISSFSPNKPFIFSFPSGFCFTPRGFYSRFIKKEIWKDSTHCWEIGDGIIKKGDVECAIMKVGFNVDKLIRLLYVEFWDLKKEQNNK